MNDDRQTVEDFIAASGALADRMTDAFISKLALNTGRDVSTGAIPPVPVESPRAVEGSSAADTGAKQSVGSYGGGTRPASPDWLLIALGVCALVMTVAVTIRGLT